MNILRLLPILLALLLFVPGCVETETGTETQPTSSAEPEKKECDGRCCEMPSLGSLMPVGKDDDQPSQDKSSDTNPKSQ